MQRTTPNEDRHSPIRKCILSGEHGDRATLIRLALGPDGSVAPDVFAKAPGRGAWIGVNHDELAKAQAKGKLAGLLRRAFKTEKIELIDDMAGRIERSLEKAFLDRLGLEARAGHLILGAEKIDAASRSGQVRLLLHASDASADGSGKRDQAWRVGEDAEGSGKGGIKLPVDRDQLSAALGRQNAVHVALIDQKAADRVTHHLGRWLNFKGCSNAPLDSGSNASEKWGPDTDIPAID
ncbi:MAG: DUF448 domain-containing protein [Sphingorhabdus sp.]|uniref:DUF448 domain-containing protein n=1 Tax=Sphingorhabdus sp. TaxID=1902408 RepID=UPI0038FD3977